jgi:hypothetical protein
MVIVLTVGGGTEGLQAGMMAFFKEPPNNTASLCVLSIAAALYCFTIIAGLLFIENPKRTWPLVTTFLLQVLSFSSPVLVYHFTAGGRAVLAFVKSTSNQDFSLTALFGSHFEFSWQNSQKPWGIGINLLPIVMLVLLAKYRRMSNKPDSVNPAMSLGIAVGDQLPGAEYRKS